MKEINTPFKYWGRTFAVLKNLSKILPKRQIISERIAITTLACSTYIWENPTRKLCSPAWSLSNATLTCSFGAGDILLLINEWVAIFVCVNKTLNMFSSKLWAVKWLQALQAAISYRMALTDQPSLLELAWWKQSFSSQTQPLSTTAWFILNSLSAYFLYKISAWYYHLASIWV